MKSLTKYINEEREARCVKLAKSCKTFGDFLEKLWRVMPNDGINEYEELYSAIDCPMPYVDPKDEDNYWGIDAESVMKAYKNEWDTPIKVEIKDVGNAYECTLINKDTNKIIFSTDIAD